MKALIMGYECPVSYDGMEVYFDGRWLKMEYNANIKSPVVKTKYGQLMVTIRNNS